MTEVICKFEPFNRMNFARNHREHGDPQCIEILLKDAAEDPAAIGEIRTWDFHPLTRLNNKELPAPADWDTSGEYNSVEIPIKLARSIVEYM